MMELDPKDRLIARGLFGDFPGLHGIIAAVLEGGMGRLGVDDPRRPRVAHAQLDFNLLTGDPHTDAAWQLVQSLTWLIVANDEWQALVRRAWSDRLCSYRRVSFHPAPRWDRNHLRNLASALPAGFEMKRIGAAEVERFAQVEKSLTGCFPSRAEFLDRGVGFGIEHDGQFVAGVSSFALGGGKLEIEIDTHPDYRRRGLATALGARIIEHCLDHRLKPCWDAANDHSANLARKLGFVANTPYDAFYLQQA